MNIWAADGDFGFFDMGLTYWGLYTPIQGEAAQGRERLVPGLVLEGLKGAQCIIPSQGVGGRVYLLVCRMSEAGRDGPCCHATALAIYTPGVRFLTLRNSAQPVIMAASINLLCSELSHFVRQFKSSLLTFPTFILPMLLQ